MPTCKSYIVKTKRSLMMALSLDKWDGKIAVVTGASSGIGAAIAKFLVEQGIIVVGLARRSEIIEENATKISTKRGKLYGLKTDMSKEEDIVKAFHWVENNLGHVHILINNAGVCKANFLSTGEASLWRTTFDVNVLGLCIATREAVKIMTASKIDGHIIHINSVVGHYVPFYPGLNVYAASKHAISALAKTLSDEFRKKGSNIKITSISPGLTDSEMTTGESSNFSQKRIQEIKELPSLQPEDVAGAVGYVLSTPGHVQVRELIIAAVGSDP